MKKRKKTNNHNMHIRVSENDYQNIVAICDSFGITQAEFFNSLLQKDGYDELLQYANIIRNDPRKVEIHFEDEALDTDVNTLISRLDEQVDNEDKIHALLNMLIEDIRNNKVHGMTAITQITKLEFALGAHSEKYREACESVKESLQGVTVKSRIQGLTDALNSASSQTRKIGVNISALIRDIRLGKVSAEYAVDRLERIDRQVKLQEKAYQQTGEKLADLLFSNKGVSKVEYRSLNSELAYDDAWNDDTFWSGKEGDK